MECIILCDPSCITTTRGRPIANGAMYSSNKMGANSDADDVCGSVSLSDRFSFTESAYIVGRGS